MNHFYQSIPGWFDFQNIYSEAVREAPDGAIFVEVGCYLGRSTAFMAVEILNSGKQIEFITVDNFSEDPKQLERFMRNIDSVDNVNVFVSDSVDAAKHFSDNSIYFLFLDPSHAFRDVSDDIQAWFPKVKPGGIIAGHDYHTHIGVKNAVDILLPDAEKVAPHSWRYRKTGDIVFPTFKQLPLINLIVRSTHRRPQYFDRCIKSINAQDYPCREITVIADDDESFRYASEAQYRGLVDRVIRTSPAATEGKHGDFDALLKSYNVNPGDFRKFWFDLYLNPVMQSINEGWIWFIDDDKTIPLGVLGEVARAIWAAGEDRVVVGLYQRPKNIVPHPALRKYPFTCCQIDTGCFIFHSKHRMKAVFDGHNCDDWRFGNDLCDGLIIAWLDQVIIQADNNGNNGKTEI